MTVGGRRPVRVVVVEDHPMMLSALTTALTRAGHEVVGTAGTGAEAYDVVGVTGPGAVVVDLGLPDETGVELTRRLLRRRGDLAVIIHTGTEDVVALRDALECGARGFAYKTGGAESLLTAISSAAGTCRTRSK
jgi:DNA-binding NarL/FixJ family response regulator